MSNSKAQTTDPTVGEAPILGEAPTVTIEGREYPLRRLGVRDTFALARIIGAGVQASGGQGLNGNPTADELIGLLLSGLGVNEDATIALLASVIGVDPHEFDDPDRFPMGSEVSIIAALAEHQDLRAFFTQLGALMAKRPEMLARAKTQTH